MFELPSSVQFGASLMASKRHHPQSRARPLAAQRHTCRGWSELSLHVLGVTHVLTGQLSHHNCGLGDQLGNTGIAKGLRRLGVHLTDSRTQTPDVLKRSDAGTATPDLVSPNGTWG